MTENLNVARSPLPRMLPVIAMIGITGVILAATILRGARDAPEPVPAHSTVDEADPPRRAIAASPSRQATAEEDFANLQQGMEEVRVESERKARAQHEAFGNRYSSESVDASWAGAKEAKMLAASKSYQIEQLHAEPQSLDVDCKTSMCRIQADFASQSLADDWLTLFATNLGSEMPDASFQHSTNPDGTRRVLVYGLSRK